MKEAIKNKQLSMTLNGKLTDAQKQILRVGLKQRMAIRERKEARRRGEYCR